MLSAPPPPPPQPVDVWHVDTGHGETYRRGYFDWFVGGGSQWRWHEATPDHFFDRLGQQELAAGSVVLIHGYHLRESEETQHVLTGGVSRPRVLREPRVWRLLNASAPLILWIHNDMDCSLELPGTSHHVIYRDSWSTSLHAEYVRSQRLEPGGPRGWPWLRSFPFGSPFDGGNLDALAAARSVRADERRLLFAFRGSMGASKPSRALLAEAEARSRAQWSQTAARLLAHAPPLPEWPRRYLVDMKEPSHPSYASGDVLSYVDTLREAVFTLSPPGDVWEAYRTYEAMEAGSIPVVVDNATYKVGGCARPAAHLLATAPFVLAVRTWDDLPSELERASRNLSALVHRQGAMLAWLDARKSLLRAELASTSHAMATSSWRPRSRCHAAPLPPARVAAQQRALASYWRRPQDPSVGGHWYVGWKGNTPRPFHAPGPERGWCEDAAEEEGRGRARAAEGRGEDFTEKGKTPGATGPLVAAFECAAV